MKRTLRSLYVFLTYFGFDLLKTIQSLRGIKSYIRDYLAFKKQSKFSSQKDFTFGKAYPCLSDRFAKSGSASGHYFHQDLLIASKIFENKPVRHIDVGSRIDGFVAHVASFRKIEVIDIRPLTNNIRNIDFKQADLMNELPVELISSCDSLSCLHALEHFGLGRYGDPVIWDGYSLGFNNFFKMLKPDGKLYLSVPIGPQRVEFNAHRVFSIQFLLSLFNEKFIIDEFSFVDDLDVLNENVKLQEDLIKTNYGCIYGCGIFCLRKQTIK